MEGDLQGVVPRNGVALSAAGHLSFQPPHLHRRSLATGSASDDISCIIARPGVSDVLLGVSDRRDRPRH